MPVADTALLRDVTLEGSPPRIHATSREQPVLRPWLRAQALNAARHAATSVWTSSAAALRHRQRVTCAR
jgi:hypothetical protein